MQSQRSLSRRFTPLLAPLRTSPVLAFLEERPMPEVDTRLPEGPTSADMALRGIISKTMLGSCSREGKRKARRSREFKT